MALAASVGRFTVVCGLLAASAGVCLAAELEFDSVMQRVEACDLEVERYQELWQSNRQDALLINLPQVGIIKGMQVRQFYWAPGRNGHGVSYGVVINAPVQQVTQVLPHYADAMIKTDYERRLVSLASETQNPRHRGQSLLLCRGGAAL